MGVTINPEGTETRVLHDLVNFKDKDVVGCGDGRMTWRYTERARSVLALDPNGDRIADAEQQTPETLQSIVTFHTGSPDRRTIARRFGRRRWRDPDCRAGPCRAFRAGRWQGRHAL
jgi:hypothetical protein